MRGCHVRFLQYLLGSLVFACTGCHESKTVEKSTHIITATQTVQSDTLYYEGVLEPIASEAVLSPVTGRVLQVQVHYGDHVNAAQPICTIDSEAFVSEYRGAVTQFLEAKSHLQNAVHERDANIALHRAGVISDEEYQSGLRNYETLQLQYDNAKYQLEQVQAVAHQDVEAIEQMTLSDIARVRALLQAPSTAVTVYAPHAGVVLFPKTHGEETQTDPVLTVGHEVKNDQLLATIGDVTRLRVRVSVGERDINRIHIGDQVSVTGDGFVGVLVPGRVDAVGVEAVPDRANGGMRSFEVGVLLAALPAADRSVVHVGMSARVGIQLASKPAIWVPMAAVHVAGDTQFVWILARILAKGTRVKRIVQTGESTGDQVMIVSGIRLGEKVVLTK
ncbi:MAG: hypothetical protein A3J38_07355 [Gammaproteobacteria bacterium RIFCSPHIGHO2_12_FULL_45_9]|nr:MAG: hypothetical protein A3J38_07355 [Gammaproteobacteria bacterium RIFCSPHIGHO2_12_FULL_45_9]